MTDLERQRTKQWVENWKRVGPILEEIRRRELRNMTYDQRVKAIESVLHLGSLFAKPRTTSGMVEMQRLFQKARN